MYLTDGSVGGWRASSSFHPIAFSTIEKREKSSAAPPHKVPKGGSPLSPVRARGCQILPSKALIVYAQDGRSSEQGSLTDQTSFHVRARAHAPLRERPMILWKITEVMLWRASKSYLGNAERYLRLKCGTRTSVKTLATMKQHNRLARARLY